MEAVNPKTKIAKKEKVVKAKQMFTRKTEVPRKRNKFEEQLELEEVVDVIVKEMEEVVEAMKEIDEKEVLVKETVKEVEADPDLFIRPDGLPITFAMLRRDSEEGRSWFKLSLLFETFPKKYKKKACNALLTYFPP